MVVKAAIQIGDDPLEDFDLEGPGGTIIFAVGSADEPQSGIWRLWAPKTTSDVYVAPRQLAAMMKISLHQSGDWRYQWVSPEAARHSAVLSRGSSVDDVVDRFRFEVDRTVDRVQVHAGADRRVRPAAALARRTR